MSEKNDPQLMAVWVIALFALALAALSLGQAYCNKPPEEPDLGAEQ